MNMAEGEQATAPRRRRLWPFIPLVAFVGLAALFLVRLQAGDPARLPSALIGKPAPRFALPPIEAGKGTGLSDADLARGVHLVNVWASWCGPCRLEHPLLLQLAADKRIELDGINYKDLPENAQRFLGALGNPFARTGADPDGTAAIDWGVYGVPETFVVRDGVITHKFIGPLSEEGIERDLKPALEQALTPAGG